LIQVKVLQVLRRQPAEPRGDLALIAFGILRCGIVMIG